jgi:hypothetical protein
MKRAIERDGLLAAMDMAGGKERLAQIAGAPLPRDWDNEETTALVTWADRLSRRARRRLARHLARYGILFLDCRVLSMALRLPQLDRLLWRWRVQKRAHGVRGRAQPAPEA